jgi:site-specific recombinase
MKHLRSWIQSTSWSTCCRAAIPLVGVMNLSVSFYCAFCVALQAHNVSGIDRARIRGGIWARWRSAPGSFFCGANRL